MEKYILRYEHYKLINWEVETDWQHGINMCLQLTEQLKEVWTRHPSLDGPSRPTGQYWDLYNEGGIILVPITERKLLLPLKRKKTNETDGKE